MAGLRVPLSTLHPLMLPRPAHDSGPGWVASPFPYGSFIRYSLPVLTGAFKPSPKFLVPPSPMTTQDSLAAGGQPLRRGICTHQVSCRFRAEDIGVSPRPALLAPLRAGPRSPPRSPRTPIRAQPLDSPPAPAHAGTRGRREQKRPTESARGPAAKSGRKGKRKKAKAASRRWRMRVGCRMGFSPRGWRYRPVPLSVEIEQRVIDHN